MRMAFISEDFIPAHGKLYPGGCTYYREMLPRNAAGQGSKFGPPAWSGEVGFGVQISKTQAQFGFDTVMMKMMFSRWTPDQMRAAQQLGQRLIVDVDDHYDGLHDDNRAKETTDPEVNKIKNRDYHREVISLADVVTVTTPFLYEYYKPIAKRVVMIRNGINPNQFLPNKQLNRKPVIGWIGSMGWRSGDIETTREWLPDFLAQHDLMFYHGGHMEGVKSFSEASGVPDERIATLNAVSLSTYHGLFGLLDIGLVPLTDIDFNEAKSTVKGLEYAASNIPFVASALPEYRLLANQGVGRVSVSPDDWVRHLTELLDWKTRKKEAAVQRQRVLEHHTIVQRAHEWKSLFEEPHEPVKVKTMTVPYKHL